MYLEFESNNNFWRNLKIQITFKYVYVSKYPNNNSMLFLCCRWLKYTLV